MMTRDATEIAKELEARGVQLGKPVPPKQLTRFEAEMGLSLDEVFRKIYLKFNGFILQDPKSQILLWPLERIRESADMSFELNQERYFPIGDLLIDSDFLMCSLATGTSPVVLLVEKRELAPTVTTFYERLISGRFDFL
jgi:hypothetical protein